MSTFVLALFSGCSYFAARWESLGLRLSALHISCIGSEVRLHRSPRLLSSESLDRYVNLTRDSWSSSMFTTKWGVPKMLHHTPSTAAGFITEKLKRV